MKKLPWDVRVAMTLRKRGWVCIHPETLKAKPGLQIDCVVHAVSAMLLDEVPYGGGTPTSTALNPGDMAVLMRPATRAAKRKQRLIVENAPLSEYLPPTSATPQ